MAEHGGTPPENADVRWASVSQVETADPSTGLKDAGYADAAIPANEEHNWLFYKYYLYFVWARNVVLRTFDWIAEGVPLIAEQFAFRTHNTSGGGGSLTVIGDVGTTKTAALTPGKVITDGEQIYYYNGQQVAALPGPGVAGTELWTVNPGTSTIHDIATDGQYVHAVAANGNWYILNRSTGATVATTAVSGGGTVSRIASNGVTCVVATTNFGVALTTVKLYQSLGASPTTLGTWNVVYADIAALAIDNDRIYIAEAAARSAVGGSTKPAYAINIAASPAIQWYAEEEGLRPYAVVCDGQWVYWGGDGANSWWDEKNIIAVRKTDGKQVWRAMRGATGTVVEQLAVDDLYLWGSDNSDVPFCVDAESGQDLWVGSATNIITDTDGYRALAHTGTTTINAIEGGSPERQWYRASPTDPKRTPNHKLVIPHDSRHHTAARPRPYGESTHYAEYGTATTGSATPVSAYGGTQSFYVLEAGRYRIDVMLNWNHANTSAIIQFDPQLDGSVLLVGPHKDQAPSTIATPYVCAFREVTLTAGSHNYDLLYHVVSGTGTLTHRWSQWHIRRIY